MKRKDFLKGAGIAGLGLTLPLPKLTAESKAAELPNACTLIPSETAGPFPLDLTANTYYFRQDIRESQQGTQLNLKLKVLGLANCAPMTNVRVNVWHCTKDGVYSGYNTANNPGDANSKYLRGYQFTNADGEVEFTTIFPGWYNGRIAHIHFQVYVSSAYSAVSQLTFPIAAKNAVYAAAPALYTKGADPLSYSGDNIFSDGYALQIATLTPNTATGGYDSYLEISVQGSGTLGVGHIEKETFKVFEMGQNIPNPYASNTKVRIDLKQSSDVKMELWDLSGRKVGTVFEKQNKGVGIFEVDINPANFGLPAGNYIFQFEAANNFGVFRMPKMMTLAK